MLIFSMTVSADGFISDRAGAIDFAGMSDDLFQVHLDRVSSLGGYLLGRGLYETMSVWETDTAMRATEAGAQFADAWVALPKVVFSRSHPTLRGNARLATGSLPDEIAATLAATERDVEIGGANLAHQAIDLDLVDDFRPFRAPVVLGGGTPYWPPLTERRKLALAETRVVGPVVAERYLRDRG